MLNKFLTVALLWASYIFPTAVDFPEVIDFGKLKLFQESLLFDEVDSWNWRLGDSAYELGLTAFNDSPEIASFITLLKRDYGIDVAVETGVALGATTLLFSLQFGEVHAVEFSENVYTRAKERLKHRQNIHWHLGSSEKVLRETLPSLKDKRVLFYLDAHGGSDYWPILDELEEISKTHQNNCIVVIDDFQVPGTDIHGISDGKIELCHDFIQNKLNKIFTGYTFHYLIPKNVSRSAKFVAIPRKWQNQVYRGRVDVITGFNIYDMPIQLKNMKEAGYNVQQHFQFPYGKGFSPYDPEIKKMLFFGGWYDAKTLAPFPKEQLVYFIMEPGDLPREYYDLFSRVYTWDDDLVDNVKFFKLYYPYLMPMRSDLPPFEERKLCVMVSGSDNEYPERKNELYSERMKMVEFFETKPAGEFDIYGRFWVKRYYRDFRGSIPGDHSGEEKISTLKKYRFSVCFENTKDTHGYITEKIFACFAAGCIPIYWGPSTIETYIPTDCFIDYRRFKDREELYQYIKTMPKHEYEQYLENIRAFLKSEKAHVFSPAYFEKIFYEAATQ